MQIEKVTNKDFLRNILIEYANNCGREAGPVLADRMQNNNFLDWERIFIATEDDRIIGFCTFTKEDGIPECNYSPFVGFIFVDEKYRGRRISEKMINATQEYAKTLNFDKLYIVSDHKGLYEKYGFEKIDEKTDEMGRNESVFCKNII